MKQLVSPLISAAGRYIENSRFEDAPIFIGGCGRSGTTLLLSILSAHEEVFACPRELNLFEGAKWKGDKLILPKYYRLYRTFLKYRIAPEKKRFCEKSPSNIYHTDKMDRLYGQEYKLIQIIRDGRDVTLSKHPRDTDKYWVDPERWVKDVSRGIDIMEDPKVLTIKYEDLVSDFSGSLELICNHTGLKVTDRILDWHEHATVRQNRALQRSISDVYSSSIGKWKLPEHRERVEKLFLQPGAKKLLNEFGYEM